MTFKEKKAFAIKELEQAGIWKSNYYPPYLRIMHALGINIRFPHYNNFISNLLSMSTFFALVWGTIMYVLFWSERSANLSPMIISSLTAGLLFGIFMAFYYKHGNKKHQLTPWDEIGTQNSN